MLPKRMMTRANSTIRISLILAFVFSIQTLAQSTEQLSPTPISSRQLSGQINARDIGDSRLTTYYYTFDGNRGDIFINVVTSNFNGDLDVFTVEGLKPKTKITIYADSSVNETGRVIYMRKPERLILRIQGRTPNDDPAMYQIKFAGSFGPLAALAKNEDTPTVEAADDGPVRVNSVGTIIEDPINVESVRDTKLDVSGDSKSSDSVGDVKNDSRTKDKSVVDDSDKEKRSVAEVSSVFDPRRKNGGAKKSSPRVVVSDPFAEEKKEANDVTVEIKDKKKPTSALVTIERVSDEEIIKDARKAEKEKAAALSKIYLVIRLKNGKKFEKRMSKVSSFNVFDGVLKVVGIDGQVTKFSILEVEKLTIE